MFIKRIFLPAFIILICTACNQLSAQQVNMLATQQKKDGWQLLFNGKNLTGWHSYLKEEPGKAWQVEDGVFYLNKNDKNDYEDFADLTSDNEYENFDLKLEFKTDTCANSGVMFYVHESPEYKNPWQTGPETQIDDVVCGPDHLSKMNRAGALYDLFAVDSEYIG